MARSDVQICNLALQRVGVTATIDTMNQRVKEAMVCNTVYDIVREKALKDAPFPFSRKYSSLALSGTAPNKWAYRYVYPNDCLAIRSLYPDMGSAYEPMAVRRIARVYNHPYEIAVDDTGEKSILTDIPSAMIEYTCNVSNPGRFDASFISFFAWGIAGEIALPLARDVKFAQNAFAMYQQELREAHAAALNEETAEEPPESEFIRCRD